MSLIQHLSRQVTPFLKSQIADSIGSNIAIDSLLEQYYAIFATRISDPVLSSKLTQVASVNGIPPESIFSQVWTYPTERDSIVHELASAHHVNPNIVQQLIIPASDNVFQQINQLSNAQGQSLVDYLQTELEAMRAYLPTWSGAVIPAHVLTGQSSLSPSATVQQMTTGLSSDDKFAMQSPVNDNINNQIHNIPNPSNVDRSNLISNPVNPNGQNFNAQQSINNQSINNNPVNSIHNNRHQQTTNMASGSPPRVTQSRATNPRMNNKNANSPKKSFGLMMILLPLVGLMLIGSAWWLMSGQQANKSSSLTTASTEITTNSEASESPNVAKKNPTNGSSANNNESGNASKPKQSITFDENDLNGANGNSLPKGTPSSNINSSTNMSGQPIVGVENNGNGERVIYEFENNTTDPNSLEALSSSMIGSDSAPPQASAPTSNPTNQSSNNQGATPPKPIKQSDASIKKDKNPPMEINPSVIGVDPDPSLADKPLTKEEFESSQKSAPRKTYSPITGQSIITYGNEL